MEAERARSEPKPSNIDKPHEASKWEGCWFLKIGVWSGQCLLPPLITVTTSRHPEPGTPEIKVAAHPSRTNDAFCRSVRRLSNKPLGLKKPMRSAGLDSFSAWHDGSIHGIYKIG